LYLHDDQFARTLVRQSNRRVSWDQSEYVVGLRRNEPVPSGSGRPQRDWPNAVQERLDTGRPSRAIKIRWLQMDVINTCPRQCERLPTGSEGDYRAKVDALPTWLERNRRTCGDSLRRNALEVSSGSELSISASRCQHQSQGKCCSNNPQRECHIHSPSLTPVNRVYPQAVTVRRDEGKQTHRSSVRALSGAPRLASPLCALDASPAVRHWPDQTNAPRAPGAAWRGIEFPIVGANIAAFVCSRVNRTSTN